MWEWMVVHLYPVSPCDELVIRLLLRPVKAGIGSSWPPSPWAQEQLCMENEWVNYEHVIKMYCNFRSLSLWLIVSSARLCAHLNSCKGELYERSAEVTLAGTKLLFSTLREQREIFVTPNCRWPRTLLIMTTIEWVRLPVKKMSSDWKGFRLKSSPRDVFFFFLGNTTQNQLPVLHFLFQQRRPKSLKSHDVHRQ